VVRAKLDARLYPIGKRVSDKEMRSLRIEPDDFHGNWNYTVRSRAPRRHRDGCSYAGPNRSSDRSRREKMCAARRPTIDAWRAHAAPVRQRCRLHVDRDASPPQHRVDRDRAQLA